MNYGEALTAIGGLSKPEKMPWWAWSISAKSCVTGAKLAETEGTVCSGCYALKGRYLFPNVQEALNRREAALADARFVDAFVTVLTQLHQKTRKKRADGRTENRFRWFDSGDIQSLEMLEKINEIALRTPFVDHWLPTRETGFVGAFLRKNKKFAPNLIVRISLPLVGVTAKRRPLGLPFATVDAPSEGVHNCQAAALQGNRCLDCDQCWNFTQNINYPLH